MLRLWRKSLSALLNTNTLVYFLILCILTLLVLFTKKALVENQTLAFQILQEEGRFGIFRLLNTVQYLSVPLIYLYKFTLIAFVLWIGAMMFGYRITYRQMWHIALVSETVFLLPELIKIIWFILSPELPTLPEIINFYPLSLMNLFDPSTVPAAWHYPLKALNLFEVLYWLVLTEAVHLTAGKQWRYALAIVFTSYVMLFLLWLFYYTIVYK